MYSRAKLATSNRRYSQHDDDDLQLHDYSIHPKYNHYESKRLGSYMTFYSRLMLLVSLTLLIIYIRSNQVVEANVLMRVCDTREIKTVTSRVCMLYKRTKNSDVKVDRQGNLRMARGTKGDYSPAKLASDCCKIGCPPHIFAYNC